MQQNIDWSKAPEGTTHYSDMLWYKWDGKVMKFWCFPGHWEVSRSFHDFYEISLEEMTARYPEPVAPALPPIGSKCKITFSHNPPFLYHPFLVQFAGKTVEIVAHRQSGNGAPVAVFVVLGVVGEMQANYHALVAECFTQITE